MLLKGSRPPVEFWDSLQLGISLQTQLNPILEKMFCLEEMRDLYESARRQKAACIFEGILQAMNASPLASETDLQRIPESGPVVVVANHPLGILDGILLGALVHRVRPDLKILTNYLLTGIPELDAYCIPLDPFAQSFRDRKKRTVNERGLRGGLEWLRRSGALLVFPAGEVTHFQWGKGVTDPVWSTTAFRLARTTGSAVLPTFIDGGNSLPFHLMGLVHPGLRTARLPKEFLDKQGSQIEVRIGKVISSESLASLSSSATEGTQTLRWKTYSLANRGSQPSIQKTLKIPFWPSEKQIADALPAEILEAEISTLPSNMLIEQTEQYNVYCSDAAHIPAVLNEIGRLRELTFRKAGEGTGREVDLDRFDAHYQHLFLWSRNHRQIVGAYRFANTSEVLQRFGVNGLYTNMLFRFHSEFFTELGPALELGRSFVRPEYQKEYAPLLLLWKAIGRYVVLNPQTPVLFGAVSISNSYVPASRTLMYEFFRSQFAAHRLSSMVKPRRPFRSSRLKHWDMRAFEKLVRDVDELSDSISEFELDGKGLPVLLRHYLKVGGQVLAFNVDGQFSDVLDGLIVVDLRHSDSKSLQKYLGREGAALFSSQHE
jgi:putative hemolysin